MIHKEFLEQEEIEQRRLDTESEVRDQIATSEDPYLALPAGIRMSYSRNEYDWLSDYDKVNIVQRECEPEA